MNKTVWDYVLDFWPVSLYLPAVLVLLGLLVVVIGSYDRRHEPPRAATRNRPVAPSRPPSPRPRAGGGAPPLSFPR